MSSIFVSYASSDISHVNSLLSKNKNINFWVSFEEKEKKPLLEPGSAWREKISDAIKESSGSVIFISKEYLKSEIVLELEIPLIFKKLEDDKNYKVYPVLIDDSDFELNSYLKDIQLFNSPSTSLSSLSGRKYQLEIESLVDLISSNIKRNVLKLPYFKRSVIAFVAFVAPLLLYFTLQNNGADEIQVTNNLVEDSNIEQNLDRELPLDLEKICLDNSVISVENENEITNPIDFESLSKTNCAGTFFAQIYFLENLKIDINEELPESSLTIIYDDILLNCADSFQSTYGFTSNETLFDFQYLYFFNKENELGYFCYSVLKELNSENITLFTENLIALDIEEYRLDYAISDISPLYMEVGDCANLPKDFYGSRNEDGLIIYPSISCMYPHNLEITNKFIFNRKEEQSLDQVDEEIFSTCALHAELMFSNIDHELLNNETKDGFPWLDKFYTYDIDKISEYEPSDVICSIGFSGDRFDIKKDFSFYNLVNDKLFQREEINENFIEIKNCSDEPLKATAQDDDEYFFNRFDFKWNFTDSLIKKFYFSFKDFASITELEFSPLSDRDLEVFKSWEANVEIAFSARSSEDKGLIKALVELQNGQVYEDICEVNLYLENE